jgi:hypothetical protein
MKHATRLVLLGTALSALAACSPRDNDPLPTPRATPNATTAASTTPATPGTEPGSAAGVSADPAPVPGKGADVAAPRPESGMIGGASGQEASGGKPGTGTRAGAGTGATLDSGDRTKAPR